MADHPYSVVFHIGIKGKMLSTVQEFHNTSPYEILRTIIIRSDISLGIGVNTETNFSSRIIMSSGEF
jgi:hypothetical protein